MIISVVIPTYNRKGVLARTLPTVLEQNFPSEEFEVVVVVDGSSDGTVEMLGTLKPRCGFQVVEQTNRGPAAARNAGVATARGRLVLFLDDDIRSGRDLIAHHVSANENTSLLLVHGPILVAPESPPTLARHAACAAAERLHKLLAPRTQLALPEHADLVCNSSMPRSVFLLSGGFNATMPLQRDDCEFGLRLWKMGVQFQYEVGAIAYEFFVKSSRDFVQHDAVQCGKGEVRLCREHPEYRRYSTLATLGGGASVTRTLRRIALGPLPFEQSLVLPVSMCEQFQWISVVRSAGIRLLGFQRRLTFLRSASREAGSYTALQRAYGLRLPVLLYHNIAPEGTATTAPSLTLSPQQFDKQMRWLARRGYHAILPSQWLEWCRTGRGLPKKPVLLTFDDAYASLVPHALPVLAKLGFGAAVFVVTRQIGGTNEWEKRSGRLGTDLLMSASQIKEAARQGIEFGAHSRTHRDLTTLSDQELAEEVEGSALDLKALLGRRVISFAYPYGPYNEKVAERVRLSFDLAFTCDEGPNFLHTDPFVLRRSNVSPGDLLIDFAFRVWFGWIPMTAIRSRLRLRSRFKRSALPVEGRQ